MKNYVIINGVNSLTITGLAISKLPSISKPPLRVMTEEINGRDGDLITELGYGAYDKELVIGLYGNYDINEVIGFFNQEGTIVFSNENDKYYNFKIINQIDYEALIKFRTATINLHCQPFKYPLIETPEEITTEYVEDEGETITLNDTKIAPLSITPKGNISQNSTTGKQEFNFSLIPSSIVVEENGRVIKPPLSSSGNGYVATYVLLKDFCPNLQAGDTAYLYCDTNYNTQNKYIQLTGTGSGLWNFGTAKTLTQNDLDGGVAFYSNRFSSGETSQLILTNFRITKTQNASWEPYTNGVSPNPSYPQNINVVSGDNEVVVCGKNLFDTTKYTTTANINVISNTNGTLDLQGISGYYAGLVQEFSVIPNQQYKLSYKATKIDTSSATRTFVRVRDNDNSTKLGDNGDEGNITINFTPPHDKIFIFFSPNGAGNNGHAKFENIQLEKGSTATTYEPYTSQNYPLYLGVENLFDYTMTPTAGSYENDLGRTITQDTIKLTNKVASTYLHYRYLIRSIEGHAGEKITLSCNINGTYSGNRRINIVTCDSSGGNRTTIGSLDKSQNGSYNLTATLPSSLTPTNSYVMLVIYGSTDTAPVVNSYIEYSDIQLEFGSKANSYTPYGITPIELNKIGNYQDYIYKDSGKWYLHKEVGKSVFTGASSESWNRELPGNNIVNHYIKINEAVNNANSPIYNNMALYNSTISGNDNNHKCYISGSNNLNFRADEIATTNDLRTLLGTTNMVVYYILKTTADIEITNSSLINQLEALKGAMSYEGQTNISQVNNDLPFILKVKGIKEGSGEGIINNIGNIYAKPIIELEGTGNIGIYKNGTQYFEVDMSNDNEITIDTENMEAYHNGVLKNRKVIGDYNKFTIDEGNNNIEITGELTKATITKYVRYL